MATLTSAQHVFMFLWIIGSVAARVLKAKSGEDVTLQCNSPTDAAVSKLVWSRLGLKDKHVFFFSDNRLDESSQDPRYRCRVELKDPQMKNGDASVVLKKVTVNDTGGYQCLVITPNIHGKMLDSVLLVVSGGPTKEQLEEQVQRRNVWLGVGLGLVCLVVVGTACFALGRYVFPKLKSGPL